MLTLYCNIEYARVFVRSGHLPEKRDCIIIINSIIIFIIGFDITD